MIGAIRVIDIRDPSAREKMTRLLAEFQRAKNNTVIVVYDGPPPAGARPVTHINKLTVIYAGPECDADTKIRQILEESSDPASFTVVSSDKQVYSFARWKGAKVTRVMAFYKDLKAATERSGKKEVESSRLSGEEVNDWMRYFGLDEERIGDD